MSTSRHSPGSGGEAGCYLIRVHGHLDARWCTWFDGLTLVPDEDGSTVLRCGVPDQAALHGVLHKIRDMGLPLLSVTADDAGATADEPP